MAIIDLLFAMSLVAVLGFTWRCYYFDGRTNHWVRGG
jgi:hypothetical protein